MFLSKSTIKLIKPQSFYETRNATLVTIHVFINKCCNVYVCYIPRNIYSFLAVYEFILLYVRCDEHMIYIFGIHKYKKYNFVHHSDSYIYKEVKYMSGQKKRTKFGQWLDKNKIEQKEFQQIAKIGRTTCYHLCNNEEHIPSVPVLRAVIKAIKKIDPRAKYTDFFDI